MSARLARAFAARCGLLGEELLGELPVGGEILLAAELVVVNASDVRTGGVNGLVRG
jgi:hypothetical protein